MNSWMISAAFTALFLEIYEFYGAYCGLICWQGRKVAILGVLINWLQKGCGS